MIRKPDLGKQYHAPENPYSIALEFGLERLYKHLEGLGQTERLTHVVVERRGKREDEELELQFRRICDGANFHNTHLPFEIVMAPKASNAPGMQLADLVARPIGIKTLRPQQSNRAYDILETKFRRSPNGEIRGWGLKTFPKCEGPPGISRCPAPTGHFQSNLSPKMPESELAVNRSLRLVVPLHLLGLI